MTLLINTIEFWTTITPQKCNDIHTITKDKNINIKPTFRIK